MTMDEKGLKVAIATGAVKKVHIIANGSDFTVRADTPGGSFTVGTAKKFIRTWSTVDGAMKWLRNMGIGKAQLEFSKYTPKQRGMKL